MSYHLRVRRALNGHLICCFINPGLSPELHWEDFRQRGFAVLRIFDKILVNSAPLAHASPFIIPSSSHCLGKGLTYPIAANSIFYIQSLHYIDLTSHLRLYNLTNSIASFLATQLKQNIAFIDLHQQFHHGPQRFMKWPTSELVRTLTWVMFSAWLVWRIELLS